MSMLKGYFDDSGDSSLPALSVAGYVGTDRLWEVFEKQWATALALHEIPYFHMKEISDPQSPMHKFYGTEKEAIRGALFGDLAAALNRCWVLREFAAMGCVVPLDALKRFNEARGRSIQALPLAIFTCDVHMQVYFEGKTIETMIDRITKPEKNIAIAKEYLATSPAMMGKQDLSALFPAKGDLNAKTVKPLQAADFAAWEVRKKYERLEPFFQSVDLSHVRSNMGYLYEYEDWFDKSGRSFPDERKSLTALGDATTFRCPIWTYEVLCAEDDQRDGKWK
jgi:hypothetical protein